MLTDREIDKKIDEAAVQLAAANPGLDTTLTEGQRKQLRENLRVVEQMAKKPRRQGRPKTWTS